MNRIDQRFRDLQREGRKAFIAYITAGDPDFETTTQAALGLAEGGVDIIELGLPFSDPLADGPVIQAAGQRALSAGFTLQRFWSFARELRAQLDIPLAIMTYYNPILAAGVEHFVEQADAAGIDALLVPDLPIEEAEELETILAVHGLHLIRFIAPTTNPERMARIARTARGFIYCVSLTGVTGERQTVSSQLPEVLQSIREYTQLPLCVGFGVSNADQAKQVGQLADGVIIGSAIVRSIDEHRRQDPQDVYEPLREFAVQIRNALDNKIVGSE